MQKWLLWTEHQYRLPPMGKAFQELGGKELCAMSEDQFRQRSPLGGDVLHAHLDIWKSGGTWCGREQPPPCLPAGDTKGSFYSGVPAGRARSLPLYEALNPAPGQLPPWSLAGEQPRPSQPWPNPQNLGQSTGEVRRQKLDCEAVRRHS